MKITLEKLNSLSPASYNPRSVDPKRLDLVRLSLQKLGWLIPVYATKSGQILSGHQRTTVARDLGYQEVPVVRLPDYPDNERKAINILFNCATNDFDLDFNTKDLARDLLNSSLADDADSISDWPLDNFPCMNVEELSIEPLLKVNTGRWIPHALNVSKSLWAHKIILPVIIDPEGNVINGIGRLQMFSDKRKSSGFFVKVPADRADFARSMLNLLSMDFDIHTKYADVLRFNSFRRAGFGQVDCFWRWMNFAGWVAVK